MLSNTSKYAIRAVIYIAANATGNRKIGIKKLTKELNIPAPYLGKILQTLVRRKLLSSLKGPNGGFGTGINPSKITLYDVIVEIEGVELFESCLLGVGKCESGHGNGNYCALHHDFVEARQKLIDLYKSKTIAELAGNTLIENSDVVI